MKKIINKKNTYLLLLLVICLLGIVIVPTYAKFASNYTTADNVVGMSLSFNLSISSIEEYEEIVDYARFLGMSQVYIQEGGCVGESFIPPFNYEGIERNV